MYDLIIIGAGPAGISAGLYSKRAGVNVAILYHGESNLEKAEKIENYYGFEEGVSGQALYENGINQAKNIDIPVLGEEVLDIKKQENDFIVVTENNTYLSKSVILATGNKKLKPNIDGIQEFEGKGISYCAVCDGFFYRNKDVAVIGNGKYAISEAKHLKDIANKITILTNGEELRNIEDATDFDIIDKKIRAVLGDEKVSKLEFEDGSFLDISGIFVAIGEAGAADFAKKMGIVLNGNTIEVDKNMKTNIDGLYSCGDSTGGLLQICKAVYEGAKAGLAAAEYIKNI